MKYAFDVLLSQQIYLDANRLHFWNTIKSKKLVLALSRLIVVYIIVAVAVTYLQDGSLAGANWIELGLIGVIGGVAVFSVCYLISYLTLPRRCKRLFFQQKMLHQPGTITIADDAINAKTLLFETSLPYGLAHQWVENPELFLIYHSENSFQMIPKSEAPAEAIDSLRQNLKAHDIPGRAL